MFAPYDAGLAAPCRHCGSTGGHWGPHARRPSRARGLCQSCESKHAKLGILDRYPLLTGNYLVHPVIPRHYLDPYMLGCDPRQHAVRCGYDAPAVMRDAEADARRWLADTDHRRRGLAWVWAQTDETQRHLLFA
jgi:hypothetical protein